MKSIIFSHFAIVLITLSCSNQNEIVNNGYDMFYPKDLSIALQKDWGGVISKETLKQHKIERITLHHGGVEFKEDKDLIDYLKNLQSWSRSEKKWIDIPYHFLIDLNGKIYEGRLLKYPGDTNTTYDPTGHLLICLIGNYEIQKVNSKQLKSVIDLITFFCKNLEITVDQIKGHKDYSETACPGEDFYKYMKDGTIVNAVSDNLKLMEGK